MTPVTPGTPVAPDGSDIPLADGSAPHDARGAEPRLPSRVSVRGMAWSALVALWLLCGCGAGDLAVTGGSIPPGGTRLVLRVAAAENPLDTLSGATIQVTSRFTGGSVTLPTKTSLSDGTNIFTRVPTDVNIASTITVTVTPDPTVSPGRQSQTIAFQANNGVDNDLVVSLPLNTFSIHVPNVLQLEPIDPVETGGSATIHALLLNQSVGPNGIPIVTRVSAEPTLLYTGNFGSIGPEDTFQASTSANGNFTGTVTAFWPGLPSSSTQVTEVPTANPGSGSSPQAPPDLPPPLQSSSTTSVRAKR